jgi:hypothetical protein
VGTRRGDFDFARIRDAACLNWRCLDPRAGRIAVYGSYRGPRLLGYVAIRRGPRTARTEIIDDMDDAAAPIHVMLGDLDHS